MAPSNGIFQKIPPHFLNRTKNFPPQSHPQPQLSIILKRPLYLEEKEKRKLVAKNFDLKF